MQRFLIFVMVCLSYNVLLFAQSNNSEYFRATGVHK